MAVHSNAQRVDWVYLWSKVSDTTFEVNKNEKFFFILLAWEKEKCLVDLFF